MSKQEKDHKQMIKDRAERKAFKTVWLMWAGSAIVAAVTVYLLIKAI